MPPPATSSHPHARRRSLARAAGCSAASPGAAAATSAPAEARLRRDLRADGISVLGRVDDAGRLTPDARERLRLAATLQAGGVAPKIVVHARWSYRLTTPPEMTEARTMAASLRTLGVPEDSIILEERSCDTVGSLLFLRTDVAEPSGWRRLVVVTSIDHLARTRFLTRLVFGDDLDVRLVYGRTVMTREEQRAALDREKRSLRLMASTWFAGIEPGDHAAVASALRDHPGYNPAATVTPQEMLRRVDALR